MQNGHLGCLYFCAFSRSKEKKSMEDVKPETEENGETDFVFLVIASSN